MRVPRRLVSGARCAVDVVATRLAFCLDVRGGLDAVCLDDRRATPHQCAGALFLWLTFSAIKRRRACRFCRVWVKLYLVYCHKLT